MFSKVNWVLLFIVFEASLPILICFFPDKTYHYIFQSSPSPNLKIPWGVRKVFMVCQMLNEAFGNKSIPFFPKNPYRTSTENWNLSIFIYYAYWKISVGYILYYSK
jgi:hypothetical protein